MISIIVCSRNEKLPIMFIKNIAETIGVEYELICIDNSENKYSLCKAYNLGIVLSKFEHLCFVHEDVYFHTQNWGKKIMKHLQKPDTGILGIAGGDLATVVPTIWSAYNTTTNIIQSDHTGKKPTKKMCSAENSENTSKSVVLLDGVFLCANRTLFDFIKFDESIKGFHGYDYDITIQSFLTGHYNYVVFDIIIEHFSTGNINDEFYRNLITIYKKWEKQLPLFERSIPKDIQKKLIPTIENRRLKRLTKNLVKCGFPTIEIIGIVKYYTNLVGSKKRNIVLKFIRINLLFIRIISKVKYK
jgi:hypothetical protein